MKGDFTRDTFNPAKHFLRVLMQQGRVELDADSNEQTAILLHYIQTLAADIIGPHGGPEANIGFAILPGLQQTSGLSAAEKKALKDEQVINHLTQLFTARNNKAIDFVITSGRYYVDGVLCENDDEVLYSAQANYPGDELASNRTNLLVYLDVWERVVSAVEDPGIREVALGGPDTAARTRVEWQVRVWPLQEQDRSKAPKELRDLLEKWSKDRWSDWVNFFQPANRGRLIASVDNSEGAKGSEPCVIHPEARFRGAENQLYRVEIHRGGAAREATFKWSRENGSVTFPILEITGDEVTLAHLGRDHRLGLKVNDWVEVVDDRLALQDQSHPLFQVAEVEPMDARVKLKASAGGTWREYKREDGVLHPYLRRWDHKADKNAGGAVIVPDTDRWIALEDNIRIQFTGDNAAQYRAGDYWLIPARTATGNVEWPRDEQGELMAQPPRGVEHHYAPLAIWLSADQIKDVRLVFKKAT
jgi:Family of unknown function (DUF6519)